MKYLKITFIILGVFIVVFSSCKKSDGDPTLPFGTRDALITNTWQLTKLSKTITTVNSLGSVDKRVFSFDGKTMTEIHTNIFGGKTEDIYSYSDKLEILKDNTYKKVIEKGNEKYETNAFWYWHNSKKKKIGIKFDNGTIYFIKRLARKELILEYSEYSENTDNNNTTSISNNEILTYIVE